tara:strand:- start:16744 stop:18114 length:1371 start_codon:yes stop_codon:yes gene_type:complete
MSYDSVITIDSVSKIFDIYEKPIDRLKQSVLNGFTKGNKKYYKTFQALKDISFTVKKGETVGIIGRNGAGKSTLLQIICNTLSASNGNVEVNGRVAALLELGAGFNPEFTGKENVYMNASVLGLTDLEIDQRYQKILDFADIGDFIDSPVKTYSSGMYVRLAFAVIAHVDADILIVDEALAVGDVFFTQKCMRFLKSFMKTGTVLFVSHDTSMIQSLCDRAIILEKGKILMEGSAKAVSEYYVKMQYSETQRVEIGKETDLDNLEKNNKNNRVEYSYEIDPRFEKIKNSSLCNRLEVFEFNEDSDGFGEQGVDIVDVYINDREKNKAKVLFGDDVIELIVDIKTHVNFGNMIVGFNINNKYGQKIIGENTYLTYFGDDRIVKGGENIQAKFEFILPVLPIGEYTISVAVADGDQDSHVQHVWLHDALILNSMTSHVSHGLIGIPFRDVTLEIIKKQ